MNRPETATIYTVPATWVHSHMLPTEQPYRRVVGVEDPFAPGEISWARIGRYPGEAAYVPDEAVPEEHVWQQDFTANLWQFFQRFYVNGRRVAPDSENPGKMLRESANCHRFAYWMGGVPCAREFEFPPIPDEVATDDNACAPPLALGQQGVIAPSSDSGPGYRPAYHSIVGLGEDSPECLQVMARDCFLGIDTYDNVLRQYGRAAWAEVQIYAAPGVAGTRR